MKVTKLEDADEYVRVLYYGDYGTGKTSNIAHAANRGPLLLVDLEGGIKRKALQRLGTVEKLDAITLAKPDDYDDLDRLFFKLKKSKRKPYAVGLDSGSETQRRIMRDIAEAKVAKNSYKDPFHNSKDDWGRGNNMIRRWVSRMHDLPIHLAISALQRLEGEDESEGSSLNRYVPAFTPGVQGDLGGYMDIVMFCRTVEIGDELEFQGITYPTDRWAAKDRYHILPRILVNPTFDRIIDYVEGRLTPKTDPMMQEARAKREASKRRKRKGK